MRASMLASNDNENFIKYKSFFNNDLATQNFKWDFSISNTFKHPVVVMTEIDIENNKMLAILCAIISNTLKHLFYRKYNRQLGK